jgi:hypothetical protein
MNAVVQQQQMFDLTGAPLTDPAIVYHRYSFSGDLARRMLRTSTEPRCWR